MTVGAQTLKIILLDSVKEAKDSVTVPATGLATKAGWHTSGCLPMGPSCLGFAQLPTGRIFTALNQADYPYYSDDDGATWHHLTNFPVKGIAQSLVATPQNEILITIPTSGIYYSADKGQTWQQRQTGLPNNLYNDVRCTASGVLIFRTYTGPGPYYSTDKGVTWQLADATGIIGPGPAGDNSSDAQSMSDGTILAFFNGVLTKSRTNGASWKTIFTANYHTYSMLVDSNNYIFLGGAATPYNTAGIYESKDTGATWTQPYTGAELAGPDRSVSQLSVKNGYYYFYATENNILKQTRDFVNYSVVGPPISNNGGRYSYRYLVTNSNHFILSVEFQGLFYQTP